MWQTKFSLFLICILACTSVLAVDNELTFEESDDPEKLNKCYIPKSLLLTLPESKFYLEGPNILTQEDGGSVASIDPGATGTSSGSGTTGSGFPTPFSQPATKESKLLYGQYLKNGKPAGGEEVVIKWKDNRGREKKATTTTLTYEEATKIGDSSLEGYWFLNKEKYGLSEETEITVVSVEEDLAATPEPEELAEETVTEEPEATPTPEPRVEHVPVPEEKTPVYVEAKKPFTAFFLKIWPYLLGIAFALSLIPIVKRGVKTSMERIRISRLAGKFGKDAKRLFARTAASFAEEAPSISRDATLQEAAGLLLGDKDYAVVSGSLGIVGLVTINDILKKTHFGEESLAGTPVAKIMTQTPAKIESTLPFDKLMKAALKHRLLLVYKGKRLLGVVTRRSLLTALDGFFSLNLVDARNMPTVRDHIDYATTIAQDSNMKQALAAARKENVNLLVVTQDKHYVGVLGEKELLEELYNYTSLMEKMDAKRLMKQHPGIHPGATLYEANKVLLARNERTLPALKGDEIAGVLTEGTLLETMRNYFNEITQKG